MSYYEQVILKLINPENPDFMFNWLKTVNLIANYQTCPQCAENMNWTKCSKSIDGYNWRCISRECPLKKGATLSIRTGSMFEKSKLTLQKWIHIIYFWTIKEPITKTTELTGVSLKTAIDIY